MKKSHDLCFDLRPFQDSDLTFLTRVRHDTMRDHFINSGVTIDEAHENERVLYRLDCAQIVVRDGLPIGALKLCRDKDPWELAQIYLMREHQNVGIGGAIIQAIVREAREAKVGVTLMVLKANPAVRLYERSGFRIVSTREYSYEMHCDPPVARPDDF